MLVLTRKKDQSIVVDVGGVRVVFLMLGLRSDKARIGIVAPMSAIIRREEICDDIELSEVASLLGRDLIPRSSREPITLAEAMLT